MPDATAQRILQRLAGLRAGTTMCPGKLSRELGSTLAEMRAVYLDMARAGRLEIKQKGRRANLDTLKGPFRVGPA